MYLMERKSKADSQQEINAITLLENARKLIKESDYVNAEYILNLVVLYPKIEFNVKMTALAIKSFVNMRLNNQEIVRYIASKFLKHIGTITKDSETETCYSLLRTLHRSAEICKEGKIFISAYFYYIAKGFFEDNGHVFSNNADYKKEIDDNFIGVLDKISN